MQGIGAIPVFLAVVEHGSFSGAARKLGITTSAVSKRVSRLEEQIGVRLLNRSTRSLSLTEAGERYFEYAQQALRAAEVAESAARESRRVPQGVLRVSAPITFGRLQLAAAIPSFLDRYPSVELHLDLRDVFSDIDTEKFDVIVTTLGLPDLSLQITKIAAIHGVVCASPQYLAAHGAPALPTDLTRHNCLLYSFHRVPEEWVFIRGDEEQTVRVSGNYLCNNAEVVREGLLHGLGIGCLPTFLVAADLAAGRLCPLLEDHNVPSRSIYAAYPERAFVPEKVRVFVEFLVQTFSGDDSHQALSRPAKA